VWPFVILAALFGIHRYVTRRDRLALAPRLTIDAGMPSSLREEVVRAMETETDPKTLSAFAEALSGTYPHASHELRMKAWVASGREGPLPTFPPLSR